MGCGSQDDSLPLLNLSVTRKLQFEIYSYHLLIDFILVIVSFENISLVKGSPHCRLKAKFRLLIGANRPLNMEGYLSCCTCYDTVSHRLIRWNTPFCCLLNKLGILRTYSNLDPHETDLWQESFNLLVSPRQTMTVTQKGQSTGPDILYIVIHDNIQYVRPPPPPSMPPTPPTYMFV